MTATRDGGSVAPAIRWRWTRLDGLSSSELYDLLQLRSAIFVVEQDCVFLDADGCDRDAWHLLGTVSGPDGQPVLGACLRGLDPGVKYPEPSIGRVVVSSALRGSGCGRVLMTEGIARMTQVHPGCDVVIGAQRRLERFYASLGFATEGEPYDEDGIDHVKMRRRPIVATDH